MIVTIDGPAGAGKSTAARILAGRLGLPYLNSGYIYRAVTLQVLEDGIDFADRDAVLRAIRDLDLRFVDESAEGTLAAGTRVLAGGRDITARLKDSDVTAQVWRIASEGTYRTALRDVQRCVAEPHGVVAEGRDMGSVIFPEADVKFYLDATPEERARRQHLEALAARRPSRYEEVLAGILERDRRDRERREAPLVVPEGAIVLPTDGLGVEEVVAKLAEEVARRTSR